MSRRTHRRTPRRAALVGLSAAVALSSLLGACSSDALDEASDEPTVETTTPTPTTEEPTPTESPTPTVSETPTPTPTPTPEPTPTETADAGTDLTGRLLAARQVGGLNQEWTWREGETRTEEPQTVADCVRFSFAAIGATDAAHRTFLPPARAADSPTSVLQTVAAFPDEETAVRVMGVLRSWHSNCQRRLNNVSDQPHRVSDTESLPAGDDAFAYLHTTAGATPDTTLFEDVAQVRVGALIAVVVVRLDAQDYNYEPQRTPAARSLAPAAARLG